MIGKCVLIVVDQSSDADIILREGFELCAKLDVQPTVLTTLPKAKASTQALDPLVESNQLREKLEGRVAEIVGTGHAIKILTPTGDAATGIRDAAIALNADLIIIGNHPETGLGLFLGSTANVVLHDAPCHVLTVTLRPG